MPSSIGRALDLCWLLRPGIRTTYCMPPNTRTLMSCGMFHVHNEKKEKQQRSSSSAASAAKPSSPPSGNKPTCLSRTCSGDGVGCSNEPLSPIRFEINTTGLRKIMIVWETLYPGERSLRKRNRTTDCSVTAMLADWRLQTFWQLTKSQALSQEPCCFECCCETGRTTTDGEDQYV